MSEINSLFSWLQWLLTFDPILSIGLKSFFWMYLNYFMLGIICSIIISVIFRPKRPPIRFDLGGMLTSVTVEEIFFRWLPIWSFGTMGGVFAHILWALLHLYIPTIFFAMLSGLFMLRLWLGGLWLYAVFLHFFHNLWIYALVYSVQE